MVVGGTGRVGRRGRRLSRKQDQEMHQEWGAEARIGEYGEH